MTPAKKANLEKAPSSEYMGEEIRKSEKPEKSSAEHGKADESYPYSHDSEGKMRKGSY